MYVSVSAPGPEVTMHGWRFWGSSWIFNIILESFVRKPNNSPFSRLSMNKFQNRFHDDSLTPWQMAQSMLSATWLPWADKHMNIPFKSCFYFKSGAADQTNIWISPLNPVSNQGQKSKECSTSVLQTGVRSMGQAHSVAEICFS